jgi:glycogen phosphorylase
MQVDSFRVVPRIPEKLQGLRELAYNLLWSWDEEIRALFLRLDRELWETTGQNPVLMLGRVSQETLEERALDDSYRAFHDRVLARYRAYLAERTAWDKRVGERPLIAYFSAEYGLSESLPIYSGGLGVLAAHHLKSASDLGVPLVAVGLLYQEGYFRQYLTSDGWQHESYPVNDFYNLPVKLVTSKGGAPLQVALALAGKPVLVQVWRARVGRIDLYLLDTNLSANPEGLRDITGQLYGGDQENRIRQEIVLGVGGFRALSAMGLHPAVCHMNEGHSAFLSLERIRAAMSEFKLTFGEAFEAVRAGTVFTTHTAVPAGFDVFPAAMMERYFGDYAKEVGLTKAQLLALGRADGAGDGFNMAGLALRTAAFVNGVSRLHGTVSRRILRTYAPAIPEAEFPIGHVTNGAHIRSAVSKEMSGLFERYLGPDWWSRPGEADTWEDVDAIPDEELWATHERRRERLVAFARRRLVRQLEQRGASQRDIERARGVLNTRALTIGFARRVATYKRATLILQDLERLKRILLNTERPVQIIFAGKAHPKDNEAKEVLKSVVSFCQGEDVRRHALFIEDYDLVVARYLVQGVDVWLNTPRRGLEASGTSGMKVVPNGGLNVSILDGWWVEGYSSDVGWAIGKGEEYEDHVHQDYVESSALYDLLEHDIVPIFYGRGADALPRAWIARMKQSMKRLSPRFSTNRMVWEYGERFYVPAARGFAEMTANRAARARALADWKARIALLWPTVKIEGVHPLRVGAYRVGEGFELAADVSLGEIAPDEVAVEVYFGPLDAQRAIVEPRTERLRLEASPGGGRHRYSGTIPCDRSGMLGYAVRARPAHPDANNLLATGLMTWR